MAKKKFSRSNAWLAVKRGKKMNLRDKQRVNKMFISSNKPLKSLIYSTYIDIKYRRVENVL